MIKVEVTQNDIEQGEACVGGYCPIALALRRVCPKFDNIHVGDRVVEFYKGYGKYIHLDELTAVYKMPESGKKFVRKFDYGRSVEPFTLYLVEPENLHDYN